MPTTTNFSEIDALAAKVGEICDKLQALQDKYEKMKTECNNEISMIELVKNIYARSLT